MTLGKTNDANNHFTGMLWTFGGKLQNDDGSLAVKEGDDAWIKTLDTIQADVQRRQDHPARLDQLGRRRQQHGVPERAARHDVEPDQRLQLAASRTSRTWPRRTKFYSYPAGRPARSARSMSGARACSRTARAPKAPRSC